MKTIDIASLQPVQFEAFSRKRQFFMKVELEIEKAYDGVTTPSWKPSFMNVEKSSLSFIATNILIDAFGKKKKNIRESNKNNSNSLRSCFLFMVPLNF